MAQHPQLASTRYHIREATWDDAEGYLDCFFNSFNAPFWQYFIPNQPSHRQWMKDSYKLSLENPTDINFVAIDTTNGKIVGLTRWMKPQTNGNLERKWAEPKVEDWDMDVFEKFFGGMEANREKLMGRRSHWMLELLATDEQYQRQGIAASLIKWGTDQADASGLETYLDGSEKGQPYYVKWHHFVAKDSIPIPDRPDAYGKYGYKSLVRPAQ